MSIISWNCRGMAAPATIRELKELCKAHQPTILVLMETKIPRKKVDRLRRQFQFSNMFTVEPRGLFGGLCLLWTDQIQLQIFQYSPNFIHTTIFDVHSRDEFDCSFVYDNPIFQQMRGLWSKLLNFQMDKATPWSCLGDFNEILAHFEKDVIRPHQPRRAELFRDFLNLFELMELEMKGCVFTWMSNPRNGMVIREKLDKILVNWPWRYAHPNACATALPCVSSDHSPLVLYLKPKEKSGVSFKFEAYWAAHEECFGVIENGWRGVEDLEEPWGNIKSKMKAYQRDLQEWHKRRFRRADDEIHRLKSQMQRLLNQEENLENFAEIRRIKKRIDELWQQEELYWSQRARVKWLQHGDRNTKFFHATTIQRRGRNIIQRF